MALPRGLKWLLAALGGLVVLVIGAAVLLPLLIDVGRFGPLVTDRITQLTGRRVTLGSIALRILPAPAVRIAPVAVAEGARYPGRDAVRLRSLSVRLRLLPLLRGRLELGSVVLDEPEITLVRDRQGRWNYEDLIARASAGAGAGAPPAGTGPTGVSVQKATIRGGRLLIYDDAVVPGARSQARIGPIDATVSGWGSSGGTNLDLSVGLGESVLKARATLAGEVSDRTLEVTVPASRLRIADFVTLLPWLGVANPRGLAVGGSVTIDGQATIPLERLDAVQFHGTLGVEDLSYRDASMSRPLEKIGGSLAVDGEKAEWTGFTASLGSSLLRGQLQIEDYARPRIGFALDSPRLDLNELIAAFGSASPSASPSSSGGTAGGLLDVIARGSVAVATLHFQTFDLQDVRGTVSLRDEVLTLSDLTSRLYQGGLKGRVTLDLSGTAPRCRVEGALEDVDVNALAGAYDPGLKDLLRGRLGGAVDLEARGTGLDAILNTARGTARLAITRGSLTSFSMLKQLAALLEMAGGKGIGREETPFESLGGTFAVGQREARTTDLALRSQDLDLDGQGALGLDASLDLAIAARFSREATQGLVEKTPRLNSLVDQDGRLSVHLLAKGTLAQPRIALDTRSQARQFEAQKKNEIKEKVRDRLLDLLGGKPPKDQPPPPPPPR